MEEIFKTSERMLPTSEDSSRPLNLDAFEQGLKELGAMCWESYHVNFQRLPGIIP